MEPAFASLNGHRFGVIAVDPPWKFKAGKSNRSTENHYQTMSIEQISALPIASLAAKDAALFLWTTPPFLDLSLRVMRAWGFRYVSVGFTWIKLKKGYRDTLFLDSDIFIGLGHTSRKSTEMCLLGKRGAPKRADKNVREVIIAARREHSRKPDAFYDRAARLYPGPCVEIFARQPRKGWTVWGNETTKFTEAA